MGKTLTYKILESHLKSGEMVPGGEISIGIDYTLTQDSTGTMAYPAVRRPWHSESQDEKVSGLYRS